MTNVILRVTFLEKPTATSGSTGHVLHPGTSDCPVRSQTLKEEVEETQLIYGVCLRGVGMSCTRFMREVSPIEVPMFFVAAPRHRGSLQHFLNASWASDNLVPHTNTKFTTRRGPLFPIFSAINLCAPERDCRRAEDKHNQRQIYRVWRHLSP